jgi:D-xylose 1-dehydrogenase (NADP+, D-xylono-1,5-lactone-forming)
MTSLTPHALRIGVLGAAKIARAFCEGVRPSRKVTVTAIASRDADKGRAFAREVGIPQVHTTYEELLADPAIDAVYNPLPNKLHAQLSILAAEAGKHVLCEKPLATSAAEACAMFDAARRHGVYLVETYPYRAQAQTLKRRELLKIKAIGRLQPVQASFGYPMTDAANIRMDPALAGGAPMDAGCYPVSLVRTIAGERPSRVHAMAKWAPSCVDLTMLGSIEFPSGLLAQISCSFATLRHRHAYIAGDAGSIDIALTLEALGTSARTGGAFGISRRLANAAHGWAQPWTRGHFLRGPHSHPRGVPVVPDRLEDRLGVRMADADRSGAGLRRFVRQGGARLVHLRKPQYARHPGRVRGTSDGHRDRARRRKPHLPQCRAPHRAQVAPAGMIARRFTFSGIFATP